MYEIVNHEASRTIYNIQDLIQNCALPPNPMGCTIVIIPDLQMFENEICKAIDEAYTLGYNNHLNKSFKSMKESIASTLNTLVEKP